MNYSNCDDKTIPNPLINNSQIPSKTLQNNTNLSTTPTPYNNTSENNSKTEFSVAWTKSPNIHICKLEKKS